ncbi:domains rearranged methyltransferase 2 [Wolffia australiana]
MSSSNEEEIEWTDDDEEDNIGLDSDVARLRNEESMAAGPSRPPLVSHFIGMGFPEDMITHAIEEHGEGNTESILDTLLTYTAIEKSPSSQMEVSPQSEGEIPLTDEEFSDIDVTGEEERVADLSEKDKRLLQLVEMEFPAEDALSAIDRCGPNASFLELVDSILAAQMAKDSDDFSDLWEDFPLSEDEEEETNVREDKRRQFLNRNQYGSGPSTGLHTSPSNLPYPMVGFGLPSDPQRITHRELPKSAYGPPYFYFENVALAPKGVWEEMSKHLYHVEPEFVDSRYFCSTARKRGYIHNLPIDKRIQLLPPPPLTIQEALPSAREWWPSWDNRTKLNCILTSKVSARHTKKIIEAIAITSGESPSPLVQEFVLKECRRWNLIWVGLHKVAPLEPGDMEVLLGFPRNHTSGLGFSERYKCLGNSFQIDTVAYHLSVLKELFPHGLRVLSLFSGIGGAEVALHRLGIPLNLVVSVEKSESSRMIFKAWWGQTKQRGTLISMDDVKQLNEEKLKELIRLYGGFDLIIGGSPCNNLTGSNRVSRTGLEGEHSSLFYDYSRIVHFVRSFIRGRM